jgi:hypothetical protein
LLGCRKSCQSLLLNWADSTIRRNTFDQGVLSDMFINPA